MDEQQTLFPQVQFKRITSLVDYKNLFELLLCEPVEDPFSSSHPFSSSDLGRLRKKIEKPSLNIHHYLISYGDKVMGYVGIWDGWLASEIEHGDPEVEVSFLDSRYSQYKPALRDKLSIVLTQIRRDYEEDW